MIGHVCVAGLLDIEDVEDFDRAEEDSVVSWEVMSTLRMKELQAVAEQFLEQKQLQNMPKKKLVLASKLASHDIDVEQFSSFLEGFRGNRTKPARKKSKSRKEEVRTLVLVGTRSGRLKGGKSKGNWFVAERVERVGRLTNLRCMHGIRIIEGAFFFLESTTRLGRTRVMVRRPSRVLNHTQRSSSQNLCMRSSAPKSRTPLRW